MLHEISKTPAQSGKSRYAMKNIISFLALIIFISFLYGFTNFRSQDEEPAGKKIFVDNKCGSCHSIEAVGLTTKSKKKNVPDLSEVGSKHTSEFIVKYLTKQEAIDDVKHSIVFKGSDEELLTLAKWLESLKANTEEQKQ
ncbi:MAG TPA: cytochrome c [Ignavibacteria bacterium]|nr:cytochrome c [Ignavibacteria bacterium]